MISKEELKKKIKKPIDEFYLKQIISTCEDVKINSLKHLSKNELIDRAYKNIESYRLLNLIMNESEEN